MTQIIDFEDYASQRGASFHEYKNIGADGPSKHIGQRANRAITKRHAETIAQVAAKRDQLREEYAARVEQGEVRPLTRFERIQRGAGGHPDLATTQANIRLCAKYGLTYEPYKYV